MLRSLLFWVILLLPVPFTRAQTDCPKLTVTGPAGVTQPGEPMTIYADVTGDKSKKYWFAWTITDSVIMGGQGTSELKARYLPQAWGGRVTASVTVRGLPRGCADSASDTFAIIVDPGPEEVGAINNQRYVIDDNLLARLRRLFSEDKNSQLYIRIYYGASPARYLKIRAHILRQLAATEIDPARITIVGSSGSARGAMFWRIPPGVSDPAP